jgi:hypothetical protein
MNLTYSVLRAEIDKAFLQVDVFAGQYRCGTFRGDVLQHLGVLPGHHIFDPGEVVLLISLSQPDDGIHADVAQVVHGQRDFHSDRFAGRRYILAQLLDSFVGDLGG